MVFICRETDAAKTVFRYKHVAAFSLSKKPKKGFMVDGKPILSYDKATFTPDEDDINRVINGDIKPKKLINNAIKAMRNPAKADDLKKLISATAIMNIILSGDNYSAIVFVLDDEVNTPEEKAREKFLVKYITAIFKEFDITPITKINGKIKKIFKGKSKKISKNIDKWVRSGKSKNHLPTRKTVRYCRRLITYFAAELNQMNISIKETDDIGNRERRDLTNTLVKIFTNDNLKTICETTKKKDRDKLCKNLRKKNKVAYQTYKDTRKVLSVISEGKYKLPEVEFGYPKKKDIKKDKKQLDKLNKKLKKAKGKNKKKIRKQIKRIEKINYDKPKMNVNKFVKKFSKRKMTEFLQLIYMNINYVQLAKTPMGSQEWADGIKKHLVDAFGKEFATAFINEAINLAK